MVVRGAVAETFLALGEGLVIVRHDGCDAGLEEVEEGAFVFNPLIDSVDIVERCPNAVLMVLFPVGYLFFPGTWA